MQLFYLATINETECIGCTKCIQICPFDAIIGAQKQLHTILAKECTGCGLCLPPCPVDCITLVEVEKPQFDREKIKQRRRARRERLQQRGVDNQKMELTRDTFAPIPTATENKQADISAALARAKQKHSSNDNFSK